MTVFISEHPGTPYRMGGVLPRPTATYPITSATTATYPGAGAGFIRAIADAGSFLNVNLATTSTAALSSTNSIRLAPNVPELIAVSTGFCVQVQST